MLFVIQTTLSYSQDENVTNSVIDVNCCAISNFVVLLQAFSYYQCKEILIYFACFKSKEL